MSTAPSEMRSIVSRTVRGKIPWRGLAFPLGATRGAEIPGGVRLICDDGVEAEVSLPDPVVAGAVRVILAALRDPR
ncbi:MAG: hypothetical protein KF901_22250 [Myxococcales bacterium]|nr:hypothetical protein [Myxococcales bacterium]